MKTGAGVHTISQPGIIEILTWVAHVILSAMHDLYLGKLKKFRAQLMVTPYTRLTSGMTNLENKLL